jgi:serine/threonine-protein kinase
MIRASVALPSSNDVIAERYRLVAEIGRGGMGAVWKGHDERLGRDIAIKLMAPGLKSDAGMLARFEREAKAVANLTSPHIVHLHDFGVEPQPFMVMELLRGENLGQRLDRTGVLPPAAVADIVSQTARALAAAHDAGIIHRDLKPGNLFLVRDRDKDFVKVVDFGIAKAIFGRVTLQKITAVGEALGTPKYMSPEQLNADGDQRDDIWALAVIAYCCLTGSHPFQAGSLVEMVERIQHGGPTPVTVTDPSLPKLLDGVFQRALHEERARRYQHAEELAEALEQAIAGVAPKASGGTTVPLGMPLISATAEIPTAREGRRPGSETVPQGPTGEALARLARSGTVPPSPVIAPGAKTLTSPSSPASTANEPPPSTTMPSVPPPSFGPPSVPSVPPPPARPRAPKKRPAPVIAVAIFVLAAIGVGLFLMTSDESTEVSDRQGSTEKKRKKKQRAKTPSPLDTASATEVPDAEPPTPPPTPPTERPTPGPPRAVPPRPVPPTPPPPRNKQRSGDDAF